VSTGEQNLTYGNFRRPMSAGLWGLPLLPTLIAGASIIALAILLLIFGPITGVIFGVVDAPIIFWLLKPDWTGESPIRRLGVRGSWLLGGGGKDGRFRSGPLSHIPKGTYALPGLLAPSVLSEAETAFGQPFAVLCHTKANHLTVVFESEPDGAALVDQADLDRRVAAYAAWLASLSQQPGLIAAQVSVETAPDPGDRLHHAIHDRIDPNAPQVARDTLAQIAREYPSGSAEIRGHVALTYSMVQNGKKRTATQMANDLAGQLPAMASQLHAAGAGETRLVDAQRLCEIVHGAFNPRAAEVFSKARAAGQLAELEWENAGPVRAEPRWDSYWHDGAQSITWAMTQAPRGEVRENVLSRLISPDPRIARKRLTMLYRVISPGDAARMVANDVKTAEFRVTGSKRASARTKADLRAAELTESEEARGASLVSFGMLLTATVLAGEDLEEARHAMTQMAPTARIAVRPVWGSQDSAFTAALPVGLHLPSHLLIPAGIRNSL
jgi:hypothetical protein